ncbi:type IX secretion system anionic LPS delivery protein PorZ [Lacinutrix venerupis]|uniref:ABC transporter substrate-binding protein n=1 Tax=Lacinutrix venerupis TaxID=1486034 RepID=A0AAC9LLM9_9FLAO|nr:ABC transporter substrate-binding protein [Lacinutrix venerupis]APX99127.1 ABC transporter substrate-binding protein [Lacinutrix venerupis]
MKIKNILLILFFPLTIYSQDYSRDWKGYFSYLDINDISQGNSKVFGAAENAVFIFDTQTNEIKELTTINGLSGETISSIQYVEENGLLLIGFENGLMQVYLESSQDIRTVVDILNKPTIPPIDKRINNFTVYNGLAYISTDYGISVYDINALEFGDTFFIGPNGSQLTVNDIAVFQEEIFVATENGLFKADVNNSNLIDFQQWQQLDNANWLEIEFVGDKLFIARDNTILYELVGNSFVQRVDYTGQINHLSKNNNQLIVTLLNAVYVYNTEPFTENSVINTLEDYPTNFTSAIINEENDVFIGTQGVFVTNKTGFGILKINLSDLEQIDEIHPDCPLSNNAFSIQATDNNLWATYGDYTVSYNAFPLRERGYSHLIGENWKNIPYDSLLGARNLTKINVNPLKPSQVFICSFYDGLLEVNNDVPTNIFNATNSTFESSSTNPNVSDIRNEGSKIDKNGILWCTNAKLLDPLKSYNITTGEWKTYDFSEIIIDRNTEIGYSSIDIDQNEVLWIGGHRKGIFGYKPNTGELKNIESEEENLPSPSVKTLKVDKQNQVWLGTDKGLRVIYNTEAFFSDPNFEPSEIIILDDGVASELLFQQYVKDIEVDGANNKWIGTLDTGVYYLSSDGQETIYHFTKDNSPLPTNQVIDISLDETNGIVYIATSKGLVSFNSETSAPDITLQEAYVYPNPVRPNFNINDEKIKIKGITENVNIKILDIEGNLVTEAESRTNTKFSGYNLEIDGGTALWNGKNMSGKTVASGVYMVMIADLDSFETKVLKLMVVR